MKDKIKTLVELLVELNNLRNHLANFVGDGEED